MHATSLGGLVFSGRPVVFTVCSILLVAGVGRCCVSYAADLWAGCGRAVDNNGAGPAFGAWTLFLTGRDWFETARNVGRCAGS
jgi:hypothetical protein